MKVFISSVRRGLEQEREALPGLIRALGHEPVRFEDFSAQSTPSREACLQAVAESDACILLLGAHYGTVFPETGLSPTHEEFVAAHASGVPRLVFIKSDVEFEERQREFVSEVEEYSTGVFRASFTNAIDLQPKVADALRNLPTSPLAWNPLPNPPHITWRSDWAEFSRGSVDRAEMCIHAIPTELEHVSRRRLTELPQRMTRLLRDLELVPLSTGIEAKSVGNSALIEVRDTHAPRWQESDIGGPLGCRVDDSGQRSVWERLPSDSMGSVLDASDLAIRISRGLRLIGSFAPLDSPTYAIAAELEVSPMTSVGRTETLGQRSSVSGMGMMERSVRLEPDESVSQAAFDVGAGEVANVIARQLVDTFSNR